MTTARGSAHISRAVCSDMRVELVAQTLFWLKVQAVLASTSANTSTRHR